MNYLLICAMLALSTHYIHGMHKEDGGGKDSGDKRDFNYIPLGTPMPKGVHLPDQIYAQALAAMPIVCTDVILIRFNRETDKLEYFMVKRANRPAQGFWWFPGGRKNACEKTFDAAERKCAAEGGLLVASYHNLGTYETVFPDSEWLDLTTGLTLPTDSVNYVVIAFYDPLTRRTNTYQDAEATQWVDFDLRPSSLPMPPDEERQGVDVAYLDRAFDDAHRILDPLIAEGNIERIIEETIRARREHRQAPSAIQASLSNATEARPASAAQEIPQRREADEDLLQFSFDENDELPPFSFEQNPPFAHPRSENIPSDASQQSPRLLPRPDSPLTVIDDSGRQLPSPRQRLSLRQSTASAHMISPRNAQEIDNEEHEVEDVHTSINSTQGSPPRTSSRIRDQLSAQLGELRIQEYLRDPKGN